MEVGSQMALHTSIHRQGQLLSYQSVPVFVSLLECELTRLQCFQILGLSIQHLAGSLEPLWTQDETPRLKLGWNLEQQI